jgi:hypothetical protein
VSCERGRDKEQRTKDKGQRTKNKEQNVELGTKNKNEEQERRTDQPYVRNAGKAGVPKSPNPQSPNHHIQRSLPFLFEIGVDEGTEARRGPQGFAMVVEGHIFDVLGIDAARRHAINHHRDGAS